MGRGVSLRRRIKEVFIMTVTVSLLIPSKIAESTATIQYTSSGVTTIVDKFTAINYDTAAQTISVNLITSGLVADNSNIIVKTKTLQPSEVYTFPEIVGHVLPNGGSISTIASSATAITIRSSGRVVS